MVMFSSFYHSQQLDSKDCGAACLQMICRYYGRFFDLEYLRQICGVKKEGISVFDFIKASERLNLRSLPFKLSFWKFRNEVPLPCVAYWRNHHFVVVYKIKGDKIYVSDPRDGLRKYNLTEFANGWLNEEIGSSGRIRKRGVCIAVEPTCDFKVNQVDTSYNGVGILSALKFLWDYILPYKGCILKIFILMSVMTVMNVIIPIITQSIIDVGIPTRDFAFITLMLVSSIVLTLSTSFGSWFKQLINTHFAARVKLSMQTDFIYKLLKLPMSFFETRLMGDVIQRNNDYDRLESFIMGSCFNFVMAIFQVSVLGIVLFYYNSTIFAIFLICNFVYCVWVLFFWTIRKKMDIRYFSHLANNQSQWIEMLSNISDIKSYNYATNKRWQWEKIQIKLFKTRIKLLNVDQLQAVGSSLITTIENMLLIYVSALAVTHGEMTMGMLIAIQYILGQLAMPMESLIQFIVSIQLTNIGFMRVKEIIGKKTEDELYTKNTNSDLMDLTNDISLKNIYFKYSINEEYVLKNITCTLPKGKFIALVGESGCGKSTLLKILIGLYMPQGGKIKIGSTLLNSIPVEEWRSRIGVLTQDSALLNETILDNIVFGRQYNSEQVIKAMDLAHIRKDVESKPMSYETMIQENGKGMSEGQKQRILFARAIYGNPEYLFLDELTSSLDSKNELSVLQAVRGMEKQPTIILVAHRLSSVRKADLILVMKNGEIVEMGNHELLMKKQRCYYNLFKEQISVNTVD